MLKFVLAVERNINTWVLHRDLPCGGAIAETAASLPTTLFPNRTKIIPNWGHGKLRERFLPGFTR
jgi:hypothetical protein